MKRNDYSGICNLEGDELVNPNRYKYIHPDVHHLGVEYPNGDRVDLEPILIKQLSDYNYIPPLDLCYSVIKDDNYYYDDNGKAKGISSVKGDVIIPLQYGCHGVIDWNGVFKIRKDKKYGIVNKKGKIICKPIYDSIEEWPYNGNTYYAVSIRLIEKSYKGLLNTNGKEIIPCRMEDVDHAGNNFIKIKNNGFWGVVNGDGKSIIPTDRGYTSIGDYNITTKRFSYTMDGYKGECDSNGRQISKIKIEKPLNNGSSLTKNDSHKESNSSTQEKGLLYSGIYTQSGQGRSQISGEYTNDIGESTWEVKIYEDDIFVGGTVASFKKKNGNTRVYTGTDILGQNVTYYVDGNFNIRMVTQFDDPFGSDWFEYAFQKGKSTMPTYKNKDTPTQKSRSPRRDRCVACAKNPGRCNACDGSGEVKAYYSQSTNKWYMRKCTACGGNGVCHGCKGDGYLDEGVDF